ncbi:MMPL family transporter [Streptomyces sp. NPDC046215]|uniref:MMPL family transporter n=1 Tax=Streptomyces TaxID=1883 RepID=UPI0031DEB46B
MTSSPPRVSPPATPPPAARTVRRAWRGVLAAVAALCVLGPAGAGLWDRLDEGGFAVTGSPSERVEERAAALGAGTPDLVLRVEAGEGGVDAPRTAAAARALTDRLRREPGVRGVAGYWDSGHPGLRSRDGTAAVVTADLAGSESDRARSAADLAPRYARTAPPLRVSATGSAWTRAQATAYSRADLIRAELIAGPVVLALLAFAFRSLLAALLPTAVALLASVAALAGLHGLSYLTPVSTFAVNLVAALGFGLAVDYGLFLLNRYQEERAHGAAHDEAVRTMLRTAGRAVGASAATVTAALCVLLVFPVPFLRSMALAGALVTVLAAVSARLLVPVLLTVRTGGAAPRTRPPGDSPRWRRLAVAVTRRPVLAGGLCSLVLAALMLPGAHARFGLIDERVLPRSAEAHAVADRLRADFGFHPDRQLRVVLPDVRDGVALDDYARRLSALPGASRVDTALGGYEDGRPTWRPRATAPPLRGTVAVVTGRGDPQGAEAAALLADVRRLPAPGAAAVTGPALRFEEITSALRDHLPPAGGLLCGVTLVMLIGCTRSLLIPVKALAMAFLSLTAGCGALVLVFQDGWSPTAHFATVAALDSTIPLLMFCVAFGLCVDYEIFLISRIREEYLRTGDNTRAVITGIARTGRVFTLAACAVAVAMAALATSRVSLLQQLGVGLAVAVLVDATLVRGVLVPAFLRLTGRANWWPSGPAVPPAPDA